MADQEKGVPYSVPYSVPSGVQLDLSNPWLRDYTLNYFKMGVHTERLREVAHNIPAWKKDFDRVRKARNTGNTALRPLAAVFDIDEVLLCNIHLNRWDGEPTEGTHPPFHIGVDFFDWPATDELNPPYEGAMALLRATWDADITPFFVTGRYEEIREETVENFLRVGFASEDGSVPLTPEMLRVDTADSNAVLHMCPGDLGGAPIAPFKEERRAIIARDYDILFNIGDQVSDLGNYGDTQYHCGHHFYFTP